jgi:GNAT superfamily N-acetyltransferase
MGMTIRWKAKRLDESEEPNLQIAECLLEIDGRIEVDGAAAGEVAGFYLWSEFPDEAFFDLWDLDGGTCAVFEEIIDHDLDRFREPLPRLLGEATGILGIHYIALAPPFRRRGLGRQVIGKFVHAWADERVGAVLLNADPLQHRPHGYDDFDDEVRDLPWNSPDEDREKLMQHFRGWGMQRLPRTRFMVAAPDVLTEQRAETWPPAPIEDNGGEDDELPF